MRPHCLSTLAVCPACRGSGVGSLECRGDNFFRRRASLLPAAAKLCLRLSNSRSIRAESMLLSLQPQCCNLQVATHQRTPVDSAVPVAIECFKFIKCINLIQINQGFVTNHNQLKSRSSYMTTTSPKCTYCAVAPDCNEIVVLN